MLGELPNANLDDLAVENIDGDLPGGRLHQLGARQDAVADKLVHGPRADPEPLRCRLDADGFGIGTLFNGALSKRSRNSATRTVVPLSSFGR